MNAFLVFILLAFMAAVAAAVLRLRSLFAAVMLFGMFSFLSATLFVVLDAVDVAFTEAAVGAGIATVLMLATRYRGYDTLGEVAVIFTAGIGVMALLGGRGFLSRRPRSRRPQSRRQRNQEANHGTP